VCTSEGNSNSNRSSAQLEFELELELENPNPNPNPSGPIGAPPSPSLQLFRGGLGCARQSGAKWRTARDWPPHCKLAQLRCNKLAANLQNCWPKVVKSG